MALRSLPPRIGTTAARVAPLTTGAGSGFQRTDGLSAAARGYDGAWRRLRNQILAAEPLCRNCAEAGRVTAATEVHHLERFNGLHDPKRLDPRNCAPICRPCHARESQRQATGRD